MFIFKHHHHWYKHDDFPPVEYADRYGVVAFGGEYSSDCFERAYRRGIFPWPDKDQDLIPWFCPSQRFVLYPDELHLSHSLRRQIKHHPFEICADRQFPAVIHHCATVKREEGSTWITQGMESTFCELHERGIAHSIECYLDGKLVGGFYGTCIGHIFGGESMFTLVSDAAKIAFVTFVKRAQTYQIPIIDCQCYTDNMARYGARHIDRKDYLELLNLNANLPLPDEFWQGTWSEVGSRDVLWNVST